MTLLEGAALATFGARHRRVLYAILRSFTNSTAPEDGIPLPPRASDESLIQWACRCRAPAATHAELDRAVTNALQDAARDLSYASSNGIVPLAFDDERYPPLLGAIPDPPVILWTRGDVAHLQRPALAMVGSRAATPHGLEIARRLGRDLAQAGFVIVSGLARGIDSAAHSAALAGGGATIAVLGTGVDRVYPAEHADLARNIRTAGVLVSEFPPRCPPLPHHFPLRNRIISGLAHAVIVIEAPEKSGSLITAAAAAEQGRDVLVVPGPVAGGRNRGGHLLIRDGARLVETADDILQEIGHPVTSLSKGQQGFGFDELPPAIDFSVDDLAAQTGDPPGVVLARLLDLELSGQIQRIGGGRFVRTRGRVLP